MKQLIISAFKGLVSAALLLFGALTGRAGMTYTAFGIDNHSDLDLCRGGLLAIFQVVIYSLAFWAWSKDSRKNPVVASIGYALGTAFMGSITSTFMLGAYYARDVTVTWNRLQIPVIVFELSVVVLFMYEEYRERKGKN